MSPRNLKRLAPTLTDEVRQQLAQGLARFRAPEAKVFKGNEQEPLISIRSPANGRINLHGVAAVEECAKRRQLSTPTPGALLRLKSPVAGYLVFEPVVQFESTVPELYELKWSRGNSEARIDLLPALQPINMEVPKGYVTEIQFTMENLGGQYYLLLHVHHAHTRAIQERDGAAQPSQPAAGEQAE